MKKIKFIFVIIAFCLALLLYPETYQFVGRLVIDSFVAIQLNEFIGNEVPVETPDDSRTKVVFMFDDGWESVYTNAYPILKKYNYKGSLAIIPSLVNEREYMSYTQISQLYMEGWDALNHTYSHKEDMYAKCEDMLIEFERARAWMNRGYLIKGKSMAVLPYGEGNPYLIKLLDDVGYDNVRTSDNIILLNKDEIAYYPVTAVSLVPDMEASEIKSFLLTISDEKRTVLFILHKIGENPDPFQMTYDPKQLKEIIEYIHSNEDIFQVIPYSGLFS